LLKRWRDFDWLVPGRAAAVSTLVLVPQRWTVRRRMAGV